MNASVTAREIARVSLTQSIKDAARKRVAVEGAVRLSVRAVARDLGMVSSALYRYFPTRDDLLTALIVDAYNALGSAVEQADAATPTHELRARWRAICSAVRIWGKANPHEYGLIFGSPIPDYRAPQDTVGPAARVPGAALAVIRHGWSIGAITVAGDASPRGETLPDELSRQARTVADELAPDLPAELVVRAVIAWTQLFGMVTFELFGQFVGSFDPADRMFDCAVELMSDFLALPSQRTA